MWLSVSVFHVQKCVVTMWEILKLKDKFTIKMKIQSSSPHPQVRSIFSVCHRIKFIKILIWLSSWGAVEHARSRLLQTELAYFRFAAELTWMAIVWCESASTLQILLDRLGQFLTVKRVILRCCEAFFTVLQTCLSQCCFWGKYSSASCGDVSTQLGHTWWWGQPSPLQRKLWTSHLR